MTGRQEEHNQGNSHSMQLKLMNTSLYISISNTELVSWKKHITSWFQYIEKAFSRFLTHNELWLFNQAPVNELIQISPVFYDILQKAEEYRKKTEGRFSPFLLNELEAHGYNQSFPFKEATTNNAKIESHFDSNPLEFHEGFQIIKRTDQKIDLGGIAKGYAVEAAAKWLRTNAKSRYGIVDGGGDMSVWSNGEKTWDIGIMNPYHEDQRIGSFQIQNGGVATSNTIYRSWLQGGTKKHHLLDGRTGNPVKTSIIQATVVMNHCLDAEIGAKVCFMNDGKPIKSILNKLEEKNNFLIVNSDENIEMG